MKEEVSVLVVDDEAMMRNLLQRILRHDGYQVEVAAEGESALDILETGDVSIVIADISMPGMSGFDLLQTIKERYPTVSVIMMTAYGDTYTVKDALLLGADEYVTKPFKSFEISMVVERAYWRQLSQSDPSAADLN